MDEQTFNKLPLAQRKALQQRLTDQNLYGGSIDGQWGAGTAAAFDLERERKASRAEAERKGRIEERSSEADAALKEAAAKKALAETETATAEANRKRKLDEEYQRQESSALGIGTKIAAGPVALMTGKGIGLALGAGINEYMNEGQRNKNATLQKAAEDRVKGLTTRDGAVTGTKLSGAMPQQNALLRAASRGVPHLGLGALSLATGAELLSDVDPEQPFYPRMADRGFGLANIGMGTGLLTQGIKHAAQPKVSPDAQALSVINSNRLMRNNQGLPGGAVNRGQIVDAEVMPDTPQQKSLPAPAASEPEPGSRAYYAQEAKRLGVKGITRKTKAELVQAVNEANQSNATRRVRAKTPKAIPGIAGPAIAAGLAYMATPDDAYAADGGSTTGQDGALTNAAIAGGGYAGVNKLLQSLPANARQFGGKLLGATAAPMAAVDLTSELAMKHMPREGQPAPGIGDFGNIVGDAANKIFLGQRDADDYARQMRDMSEVPGRNPMFSDPRPIDPRVAYDQQLPGMVHQGGGDDFDAQLAELSALMSEFDVPEPQQAPPMPQFQIPAPMQQNRLLAR